ncbi:MAG TPA: hypothetical protein VEZ11_08190 [Thermoanaerobaculia bacterium]|nr:hypothetical protein [Thermoanaerobaculia bacterium]
MLDRAERFFFGDKRRKLVVIVTALVSGQVAAVALHNSPDPAFVPIGVGCTLAFLLLFVWVSDPVAARFAAKSRSHATEATQKHDVFPVRLKSGYILKVIERLAIAASVGLLVAFSLARVF